MVWPGAGPWLRAGLPCIPQILLTATVGGGAQNRGYGKRYDGAPSQILAYPYTTLIDAADDVGVVGIVMAELIEILMSQTEEHLHWSAGASDGEGFCHVWLHTYCIPGSCIRSSIRHQQTSCRG